MKKLLIAFSLLIGVVSFAKAGGRNGQGWISTVSTGNAITICTPPGTCYLKSIILSSGATTSLGDYVMVFSTIPMTQNGSVSGLFGGALFASTQAITPAIVFKTTSTVSGIADNLNNNWGLGDSPDSFTQVPAIFIRSSAESTGGAGQVNVIWSK